MLSLEDYDEIDDLEAGFLGGSKGLSGGIGVGAMSGVELYAALGIEEDLEGIDEETLRLLCEDVAPIEARPVSFKEGAPLLSDALSRLDKDVDGKVGILRSSALTTLLHFDVDVEFVGNKCIANTDGGMVEFDLPMLNPKGDEVVVVADGKYGPGIGFIPSVKLDVKSVEVVATVFPEVLAEERVPTHSIIVPSTPTVDHVTVGTPEQFQGIANNGEVVAITHCKVDGGQPGSFTIGGYEISPGRGWSLLGNAVENHHLVPRRTFTGAGIRVGGGDMTLLRPPGLSKRARKRMRALALRSKSLWVDKKPRKDRIPWSLVLQMVFVMCIGIFIGASLVIFVQQMQSDPHSAVSPDLATTGWPMTTGTSMGSTGSTGVESTGTSGTSGISTSGTTGLGGDTIGGTTGLPF